MDEIITGVVLVLYGLFVLYFGNPVTQASFLFFGIGWLIAAIALALLRHFIA